MINRVILIGRLTRDPELRKTTRSNVAVASFTIAVDNRFKGPNGEKTASFINCIAWNNLAELVNRWAHKGSLVGIEGRLNQRSYESKDGRNVQVVEVICDSVSFLEPKNSNVEDNLSSPFEDEVTSSDESKNLSSIDIDDDLPF